MNNKQLFQIKAGILSNARINLSPNCDDRPDESDINLIVIHNISLPPNEYGGNGIDQLFTNTLDKAAHPFYAEIHELRVSSHLLIRRDGEVVQYVPFHKRAWHAGVSQFLGRDVCNDFSIGIEMEGSDFDAFTDQQYQVLDSVLETLIHHYPHLSAETITGHQYIAPGRKTDPGPCFDWHRVSSALNTKLPAKGYAMSDTTTIIDLLRHGEPEGGEMYRGGGTDHPLSQTGWAQMKASVKKNEANWSALVTSPMLRCKEFSYYLADKKNLPVEVIENLREAGFGNWEGKTTAEIKANNEEEYWQFYHDSVNCRPPNAEPLESFTRRVADVLETVLEKYQGQHILLVSHSAVTRAMVGTILELPLHKQQLFELPFAGMLRVIRDKKGLRVVLF